MGENIVELGSGGVIVRRFSAGAAHNFNKATPAFAISTADRGNVGDSVVLTREEAVKVALGILFDVQYRKGYNGRAVRELAEMLGVDLDRLKEF